MLLDKMMSAVSQRLADESISVREAVVSLVGSYVVQSPPLANAFHQHLIPRLLDPGVSVRKRTVKILQDILCTNPHYKGRSDACDKCLQRAADPKEDDGVREALHSLFMKLWLEDGDLSAASHFDTTTPLKNGVAASPSKSPPGSADSHGLANGLVVTPTPPMDGHTTRSKLREFGKLRSELAAEQMVATVKIAGTNENLGSFMRELLCNVNDSDKGKKAAERKKRQKVAQKQCFHLVDALFEVLLSTEEKRKFSWLLFNFLIAHLFSWLSSSFCLFIRAAGSKFIGAAFGAELVAIIRTIGVFAEVSPVAVLKHLDTILPYLKADNGISNTDESALCSAASDIVFRVAPVLDEQGIDRLSSGSLGGDLVKITYKFGSGALYSAVRALCTLAHHKDAGEDNVFGKKLMLLATTFYAYLHKKESEEAFSDANVRNNIQRLLSGLGSLCRYHEVHVDVSTWNEEMEAEDAELLKPAEVTWDGIPLASFRLFSNYLDKSDVGIKCAALRALSGIFVQHPRLMLASAQHGLIENVMSPDAPLELQMESLRCWRDISLSEERRVDSGEAKKKMDAKTNITTTKKIAGDQDGDSTLVGGVLTKQSPRLFQMSQSKFSNLRVASLELLGQLLRQGLVNPNEAVPFLLALQGDVDNMVVRKFALNLLILEGEKRPDMLRQRVCAGIKQACWFQREVYPLKETSALVKVKKGHRLETESVFDNVFRECIVSSRKQREGLYRNLIAMFERVEPNGNAGKGKQARSRRSSGVLEDPNMMAANTSLLSFAAQVLAYLPYNSYGDPLFIQHHITSIVALQGPQVQDRLAAFLRPYGLSSSDEFDETNAVEDALELAAKSKAPSRSKEAAPLNEENFDWPGFVELCKEASSLALLLRLKTFLRKRYNLSEARCLSYNPDSKDRSFGRNIVSRVENIPPFDASIVTVNPNNLVHGDEDRLIYHYATFRRLMREEAKAEEEAIEHIDSDMEDPVPMFDDADGSDDEDEGMDVDVDVETPKPKTGQKRRRSSASGKKRRQSSAKKSAKKKRKSTKGTEN
jgi:cohesin loading factor subunit SCC2